VSEVSTIVETSNLGIRFGGLKAIDNVNFRLTDGELRCLIGPNGAGKTTFFRLLTGVHQPTHGWVSINGQPIAGLQTHEVAQLGVGIKTQVPSLFDNLTVRENIWLSARRLGKGKIAEKTTAHILDEIGLAHRSECEVAKLSHGRRQWVELGVVLASGPKLVLLDEPTAGMTGEEVKRTADLIRQINEKCAIIVVEHDMDFIKMIAKTVTVFNQGTVLIEDTVDKVMKDRRVREIYLGKEAQGESQ
jgi:branched-chain amino acid transport system ATP-binding protein/urea transport system ATP-binding protein